MESRQGDDAAADPPRSYCVFERDRDLPRPTPWSPLTAEATTRNRAGRIVVAIVIGLALGAAVAAGWFQAG